MHRTCQRKRCQATQDSAPVMLMELLPWVRPSVKQQPCRRGGISSTVRTRRAQLTAGRGSSRSSAEPDFRPNP
ncbi:unnamed protein product [Symbiodinium sp. KB8]|nr:unnamed protein product [Symbiodinium sp. KB8]